MDKQTPKRRSRKQVAADEVAVKQIADVLRRGVNRWEITDLRSAFDEIADVLVAAGRL